MLMLPEEVSELVEESIAPADGPGAQTFAGVVKPESFNQYLNFHEDASSRA